MPPIDQGLHAHLTDEHQPKSSLPAALGPFPLPAPTPTTTPPAANLVAGAPSDGHTFGLISGYLACTYAPLMPVILRKGSEV